MGNVPKWELTKQVLKEYGRDVKDHVLSPIYDTGKKYLKSCWSLYVEDSFECFDDPDITFESWLTTYILNSGGGLYGAIILNHPIVSPILFWLGMGAFTEPVIKQGLWEIGKALKSYHRSKVKSAKEYLLGELFDESI